MSQKFMSKGWLLPLPAFDRTPCQLFAFMPLGNAWKLQLNTSFSKKSKLLERGCKRRNTLFSGELQGMNPVKLFSIRPSTFKILSIQRNLAANKELMPQNKLFLCVFVVLKSFCFFSRWKFWMWSFSFEKLSYQGLVCLRHENSQESCCAWINIYVNTMHLYVKFSGIFF